MNDRIAELWTRAGADTLGEALVDHVDQFAELIIRECAKVAAREQALNAEHMDVQPRPQVNISQSVLAEVGFSQITTTHTKEQQLVDLCKQFIDRHIEELDQWLLRAANYYPTEEVHCEFDR